MTPELITLILNIVLGAMLLFGFLFGLKGIKKATTSLVMFIVTLVVVIFLVGPVSNWVLQLQINGSSLESTINEAVNSAFGTSTSSNSFVQSLMAELPIMFINLIVCILLILIIGLIMKIIGKIVYRIIFGKDDKKVVEEVQIVNDVPQMTKKTIKPKKHRLLGGLVGTLHGFLLAVVIFMPIIGVVNIINEIAGTNEVSAEVLVDNSYIQLTNNVLLATDTTDSSFELKPAKQLLQDNLPQEFYTYSSALDNSILAKIGKIGNLSEKSLNVIARCDINGHTVKLGEEIRTLVSVYDEFVEFATQAGETLGTTDINVIFKDIADNPENYDFDKMYSICDNLFKSNLIQAMGNDALKLITDTLVENNTDENMTQVLQHFQTAVNNYCSCNYNLKDDIKAVLGVFEISAKSGLIKEINKEPFEIENLASVLLNEKTDIKPKDEVLSNLSAKITSSNLLQKIVIEATNYGVNYLQDYMNDNLTFDKEGNVVIPTIDGTKDIRVTSTELTKIISGAYDIYSDIYKVIDFDAVSEDIYTIFDYNLPVMINIIGEELDTIVNMQLLKDTKVFENICDNMAHSNYSKYLSFAELPKSSNIVSQFSLLATSVNQLKNSNIVTTLKNIDDTNSDESFNYIIDELATVDTNNVTLSTRILQPILSCSILKNTIILGLDYVHSSIETILDGMVAGETVVVSDFNTSTIMSDSDKNQILNLVNNFVAYAKDIDIKKLKDNMVDTLVDSNLINLGVALDSVKNANLFSDNGTGSAYNDIMLALNKSDLSNSIDFSVATKTDFSWQTEMTLLQNTIITLNQIKINTPTGEKGLVSFMLNGGDFIDAYDYINSTNAQTVKPVFEIGLIKPIAINIVDTINSKIKQFVGDDLGANIVAIDKNVNLAVQAQEITNVISSAVEIDLNETDLDKIDRTKINALLYNMEINANNNGVFKESYNALLLKTANMINENVLSFVGSLAGSQITTITEYTDVLADSLAIRGVLDKALETVKSLKSASFKNIDVEKMFDLIDVLRASSTVANGVFAQTYNAVMVYIVNTVNEQVADYVGENLSIEIVKYDGEKPIGDKYYYIKILLETGVTAYKSIPEGKELKDIDKTKLNDFIEALDDTEYTIKAYNALNNKLANVVIESINSITGNTVATITTLQDLSGQANDIKTVVNSAIDVANDLSGKTFKLEEMSEDDKANALTLLNTLQTYGNKTGSVFKNSYDSVVEYIAEQNGVTSEIIYDNFATDGVIDWNKFING